MQLTFRLACLASFCRSSRQQHVVHCFCNAGNATIVGFAPTARLLPSKTRPKRIDILASDGRTYPFLLKGGEDLQQEQRMQQLFGCLNACVRARNAGTASAAGTPGSSSGQLHARRSGSVSRGALREDLAAVTLNPSEAADLQSCVLNVTPLGAAMGVVQWVPRSVTLYDIFKSWQARMLQRYRAAAGAAAASADSAGVTDPHVSSQPKPSHGAQRGQGLDSSEAAASGQRNTKRGGGEGQRQRNGKRQLQAQSAGAPDHQRAIDAAKQACSSIGDSAAVPPTSASSQAAGAAPRAGPTARRGDGGAAAPTAASASPVPGAPDIVAQKPVELFYGILQAALREAGLPAQLPRKRWPAELLLRVFRQLLRKAPAQLLASELWAGAADAERWWDMRRKYTVTLAQCSIASYLLGIGDRHLNNMLLVQGTGQIVHIDSTVCFDQGAALRVPEVVPLRLTQTLVTALGPLGAQVWLFLKPCWCIVHTSWPHRLQVCAVAQQALQVRDHHPLAGQASLRSWIFSQDWCL